MKNNTARTMLLITSLGCFLSMAPMVQAARCSQSGIAGQWEFASTGTILNVVPGSPGPFAAAGRFSVDAAGNVSNGSETANVLGGIDQETLTGSITIHSDCTATATVYVSGAVSRTTTLEGVFFDNMTAAHLIFTSVTLPGSVGVSTVISVDAKKLFSEEE